MRMRGTVRSLALGVTCATLTAAPVVVLSCDNKKAAPGSPGNSSVWNYAGKTGIGTSYEEYTDKLYENGGASGIISKVWFSITKGIVTETAYGMIHEAQIKDLQFLIVGEGFVDEEKTGTDSRIEYLYRDQEGRPLSLAYRIINTDRQGKYRIEKHVFTDPERNTLFMRTSFRANEDNITPYLIINPHMHNTGSKDVAMVASDGLYAYEANETFMAVHSTARYTKTSAGYVGASDGLTDLKEDGRMDWTYTTTNTQETGNVALTAEFPVLNTESRVFDIAIGFGKSLQEAKDQASGSLDEGYQSVLDKYNGKGEATGWEDYLTSLSNLPNMIANATDGGKLLHASALVLKAQEDKTYPGALIASLSIPWGETASAENSATGYRAVWPRDFYQCAMALLALGDTETPLVSFEYLQQVQVTTETAENRGATGWFLQKTHVNGTLEWISVQLDQTAMPVMLGWKLWKAGVLSDEAMASWYNTMLKGAADFLANGGKVAIRDNEVMIEPPMTQQERWEEQWGYSPSTTAAVITALVAAADIAEKVAGDQKSAASYLEAADAYEQNIENYMFTNTGPYNTGSNNGKYFIRITQNTDPDDGGLLDSRNGRPSLDERKILDAGFLELVRYGVRPADDPDILESLSELDDESREENLRVKYTFTASDGIQYPGWRRYGNDGYGENEEDGTNWGGDRENQRGRVWPFLTGERGHFEMELAKARNQGNLSAGDASRIRNTYVRAMENFANEGLMLSEQVWDGVGTNSTHNFTIGEGTNSATPLAWTHAEYTKLLKSLTDQNTWDSYPIVRDRYWRK